MINFAELFTEASKWNENQKKIPIESSLRVFYGLSLDGHLRLAFLSACSSPKMESTKLLRVTSGNEGENIYWTCFDLMQEEAKSVFFTFCEDMVNAILYQEDELKALNIIKKRFVIWKSMFKDINLQQVPLEKIQGLFGEIYFLKNYMARYFALSKCIDSWSGAESKSKDFAINDEWFEIKTIGANQNKVRISSLSQLSSPQTGHLVVIKAEAMSSEFNGEDCCIGKLIQDIMPKIQNELAEELFIKKIKAAIGNITDMVLNAKFSVKSVDLYLVNNSFPRLKESEIQYAEIEDVTYSLNLKLLDRYKEMTNES